MAISDLPPPPKPIYKTSLILSLLFPSLFLLHQTLISSNPTILRTLPNLTLTYILLSPILSFVLTYKLIPKIQIFTSKSNLWGKDLGKKGTLREDVTIPESLGLVNGTVFLIITCCGINAFINLDTTTSSKYEELLIITSSLFSICFMLFLGFTDDVLDWPWRYKLFLPAIASIPLVLCYNGSTTILIPRILKPLLYTLHTSIETNELTTLGSALSTFINIDTLTPNILNLNFLYLIYMSLLSIFTTNSINIHAGINGLEAGQTLIISLFVILHNIIEISTNSSSSVNHLFSLMIMLPFTTGTIALLNYNWYPSQVFVGDTYCYFAGMTLAAVGIHGHFSKTLLVLFIPQVINFILSIPQLAKVVPCPRHRLPKFNAKTGLMQPSTFPCSSAKFKMLKYRNNGSLNAFGTDLNAEYGVNLTLINVFLQLFGDTSEEGLCVLLLVFQVVCCSLGLWVRYFGFDGVFDE